MATVKGTLNVRKSKKGFQIRIRVIKGNYTKFHPLDLYLSRKSDFLVKSGKVSSKFEHAERYNKFIKKEVDKQQTIIDNELKEAGKPEIVKDDLDIFNDLDRYIKIKDLEGQVSVRDKNIFLKNKIILCIGKEKDLSVLDIDIKFLDAFYFENRTKMKADSLKLYYSYLKQSVDRIIKKCHLDIKNLVEEYEIDATDEVEQIGELNQHTLHSIINSEITLSKQIKVKHSSLFQFFSNGIRISDLTFLKFSKISIVLKKADELDYEANLIDGFKTLMGDKEQRNVFVLKFKSVKTGYNHVIELSNQALLELRFFLDSDLQKKFLEGGADDRIVKDDELSKICEYKPESIIHYFEKPRVLTKVDKDGRHYRIDDGDFPIMTYHIHRLKYLIQEQLGRTDRYIFNSDTTVDVNLDIYKKNNKDLVRKIITRSNQRQNDALERISKKIGIKDKLVSHSMRHLFAILLYKDSADLYAVKELLGHKKLETTERYLKRLNALEMNNTKVSTFYNKITGMTPRKGDEIQNV